MSCCPVPQIYQPLIRDCKTGEVRESQSGEPLLIDGVIVPNHILTEDLEVYIDPNGNDTTGTGTSDNPFYSLFRAWDFIQYIIPGNFQININVGAGKYVFDKTLRPQLPFGGAVNHIGTRTNLTTTLTVSNIDTTQSTDANFPDLQYFDFDLDLSGDSPTGVFVGQLIRINDATGGTDHDTLRGCQQIIAWNSSTEVATIRVWQRLDVAEIASGSITVTTGNLWDSVFTWDDAVEDHGLEVTGTHGGNWSFLSFLGNQEQFDVYRAVRVRDGGVVNFEQPCMVHQWDVGYECFNGAFCEASVCLASKIFTNGITVQGAWFRYAFGGYVSGCGQQAIWAQNGANVIAFQITCIACADTWCVLAETNSDVLVQDSFFFYENAGTPSTSACLKAEEFGRILATSAAFTGFTTDTAIDSTQGLIQPAPP